MPALNFLVKPASHRCNLECAYCFYKRAAEVYSSGNTFMSLDTAGVLVEKALVAGARKVSFCWQGGEPTLLGLDFYREIVRRQKSALGFGQTVENSLQTNGLLLDREWAVFLKKENILVGLSLDGPRDMHDRHRVFAGGRGSFDLVMSRAALLRETGVPFNVLTLLTPANVDRPEELYAFHRENGFNHLQFIPCRDLDPETGRPSSFSITAAQLGGFYLRLFDLWLEDGFPHVSIRMFEDLLLYLLDGAHASCAWLESCDSYLLVEHNGDCYPCDFYVRPEWRLGRIQTEALADLWNHPLRRKFAARKADLPGRCRGCRYLDFCRGDCPRFRSPGRASDFCEAWKRLLAHVLAHPAGVIEKARRARAAHLAAATRNVGRNDPCPCGSGRKYKKCCLTRGVPPHNPPGGQFPGGG
ncbi:MAG: anaerobic sulfatase maturase [Thermodesulfobacteriota bacterium]